MKEAVGEHYVESNYFAPAFVKYHGGYSGFSRVATVVTVDNCLSGHGQVVVPAVKFDVGGLTGVQFLKTIGKFYYIRKRDNYDLKEIVSFTNKFIIFYFRCFGYYFNFQ